MESTVTLNHLCTSLEVDKEFLEMLVPYLERLLAIGIDFSLLSLQDAIEGHPYHLESACRAVIGYAGWLAERGDCFTDRTDASTCFIRALVEQWQPYPDWQHYSQIAAEAKYVSPYEKALKLIYEQNRQAQRQVWRPEMLDSLSDRDIEAILPELERQSFDSE
jgi:hypothetical protein